jgi:hypothetical protein
MRSFFIWLTGILASAIVGGLIGNLLDPNPYNGAGFWGGCAGILIFTCARLWLGQPKSNPTTH